jgi:hypothetical protein
MVVQFYTTCGIEKYTVAILDHIVLVQNATHINIYTSYYFFLNRTLFARLFTCVHLDFLSDAHYLMKFLIMDNMFYQLKSGCTNFKLTRKTVVKAVKSELSFE